ncbi:MAG: signal peptidase II [Devosia sp.]|nr:signal peptidase II [Devosia sp.]
MTDPQLNPPPKREGAVGALGVGEAPPDPPPQAYPLAEEAAGRAGARRASIWVSLVLFVVAFGADRLHKFIQVSGDCLGSGQCLPTAPFHVPAAAFGWQGGEYLSVTGFFDYVLVWNTGISYGLLASLPVGLLGVLMLVAIIALALWWWRADAGLIRAGLALCIGGALSNALDRWLYGGVADFFHFHFRQYSFYIFNLADVAITFGVILLILDFLTVGRQRNT